MADTNQNTALITGASTGIGAVYAHRLAHRGYNLILVARDEKRMQTLATSLRETGVKIEVLPADLISPEGRLKVAQRLQQDTEITMLINNAGMALEGKLIDADPDKLEAMIALNIIAVTRLAGAAARNFAARKTGTIINIGSVLALAPELYNGVYSGTKAFVLNLSISMQNELAASGVKVQAVLPGATRTEIWERSGLDINALPAEMLMSVDELVDAALAGLDAGEPITIPPLPNQADFDAYTAARAALGPNLSRNHAAARYQLPNAA